MNTPSDVQESYIFDGEKVRIAHLKLCNTFSHCNYSLNCGGMVKIHGVWSKFQGVWSKFLGCVVIIPVAILEKLAPMEWDRTWV